MGMIILDGRDSKTQINSNDFCGAAVYSDKKNSTVINCDESQLVVANPQNTEVVSLGGGQYLRGEKGEKGNAPEHRWVGTAIQFRQATGQWGPLIDVKGAKGDEGDQGAIGPQGQGIVGPSGTTKYTWVKYSMVASPTPSEMFNTLTDPVYIGIAYNKDVPEGDGDPAEGDPNSYNWMRMKGADGQQGTAGPAGSPGADGSSFTWIGEYSDFPIEGPSGRPLEDGDSFLLTTTQKVYTYADGWFLMLESGGSGPIGPQGAPGGSFQYQGEFATPPASAQVNWMYKDTDNDVFYVYTGAAWETATSDGKSTSDGASVGGGLRFFTTYSDSVTNPGRPLGEGNTGVWDVDPNSFDAGTIKWVAQKLSTDPQLGIWELPLDISTHGFTGPQGFRGSQSSMIPIVGWDGNWDDNLASASCASGAPVDWDIITLYKANDPEIQETRRWGYNSQTGNWEWLAYNYQFLGDVLVDGSLDASAINAATRLVVGSGDNVGVITGEAGLDEEETYRMWVGNELGAKAPFSVTQEGHLHAQDANIEGAINASSLLMPNSLGAIGGLGLNQLSGGGHDVNMNDGWGIYSDGRAIFNGGLETRDAVISGATIVGASIFGGDFLQLVDPDTDGDPNDPTLYYSAYPTVPVGASPSFQSTENISYDSDYIANSNPATDFYILPAASTKSPITSKRLRWGIMKDSTITLSADVRAGYRTSTASAPVMVNSYEMIIELVDPYTGAVLTSSPKFSTFNISPYLQTHTITHSVAGVSFTATYTIVKRGSVVIGGTTYYTTYNEMRLKNNKSYFGSLSNANLNGYFRVRFFRPWSIGASVYPYASPQIFTKGVNVENSSMPTPV